VDDALHAVVELLAQRSAYLPSEEGDRLFGEAGGQRVEALDGEWASIEARGRPRL